MSKKNQKLVGVLLERSTRITKLTFIKAFKNIGVDITPEQWVIVDNLSKQNGQTQIELAKVSYKNTPTISRIIDNLCKKGYTERKLLMETEENSKSFSLAKEKKS